MSHEEKYYLANYEGFKNALEKFNEAAKKSANAGVLGFIGAYLELKKASKNLDEAAGRLHNEIEGLRRVNPEKMNEQIKNDPLLQLAEKIYEMNKKESGKKKEKTEATPLISEIPVPVNKGEENKGTPIRGTLGSLREDEYFINPITGEVEKKERKKGNP